MSEQMIGSPGSRQFPCRSCGASLVYAPGTVHLRCQYCSTENDIPVAAVEKPEEKDFAAELRALQGSQDTMDQMEVKCGGCGAETSFDAHQTAGKCPFCGMDIVAQAQSRRVLKPQYLLPFKVTLQQAGDSYKGWLKSLWFAPSDLRTYADRGGLKGVYTPAWTYDCGTVSDYTGQRGDDYWTTETYTTVVNGKSVVRTRQVKRTRWRYASGRVDDTFDDVLVMASKSLPEESLETLRPWDLPALTPYRDEFLAGFVAESYQVDLGQGFEGAKELMDGPIRSHVCRDIGGDHQRVDSLNTKYFDITYKHVLLPVYLSGFRYRNKLYRFLINARTGEVAGERPYSAWKIFFAVLAGLIAVGTIVLAVSRS